MNKFTRSMISIVVLFLPFLARAGEPISESRVFRDNIRTVLMYKAGFEMSYPVMSLNSGEGVVLSFDDLDADLKHYRFTILHCEADWSLSVDLTETDFISGYREDEITGYAYSYNTLVHFTHYSLKFPTENMRPRISGNYLLKVFLDDPADPVLVRRFMVVEQTPAGVTGEAHQANSVTGRYTQQEVDFVIHLNGLPVQDPFRELKVMVMQNERTDNMLRNLKPRAVRGGELDYNYEGEKTFNGGNEFRAFDTKSLVYQSERINKMFFDSGFTQVYLLNDLRRTFKNYATEKDINGRMLVKNEEHAQNSDIEADYAWVHFFLPFETILTNGDIYLVGALTGWQLDKSSQMEYDFDRRGYGKKLFLKQGYYNYLYLFRDRKTGTAEEAFIEGNHSETENEYTVFVYYREAGGLYDRLITVQNFNTIH
jgi:hypothetical protein